MMSKEKNLELTADDRKLVIKRLVIYVLLAFLPFYIGIPIINHTIGMKLFVAVDYAGLVYAVGVLGMLVPAIAHALTRFLTKEGYDDIYMQLNMKGNMKYYLASFLVKLADAFVVIFVLWRIYLPEFRAKDIFCGNKDGMAVFLTQFALTLVLIISFFGEEWGWRGYMMPKLLKIMSKPVAIVVGGIIWGLWHAPLTVSGHNFGLDYSGYPYKGIILMCVFCIAMNAFLTLLTERTKSILPASICHGINNNMGVLVILSMFASENVLEKVATMNAEALFLLLLPTTVLIGVVSMILFCRRSTK